MSNCPSCPLPTFSAECHCPTCGEHFSTPGNFDRHRRNGQCRHPTTVGLVPATGRRPGAQVWVRPGDDRRPTARRGNTQTDEHGQTVHRDTTAKTEAAAQHPDSFGTQQTRSNHHENAHPAGPGESIEARVSP